MRALESLSDHAMTKLAIATNVPRPVLPPGLRAPKFWEAFADIVAHEIARRHGMVEAADEPRFPDLNEAELEVASLSLLAMSTAERDSKDPDHGLADALRLIASSLTGLRQTMATEGQGN